MAPRIFPRCLLAAALLLLHACAQQPEVEPVAVQEQSPEISLNLPQAEPCVCPEEKAPDYTFLEKGLTALAAKDYVEAVQYFQRYQRLESGPEAQWESGIAIAYVSSLSNSPFYDAVEARKSYWELSKQDWRTWELNPQALLLHQSLQNFIVLERHVEQLEATNRTLREDLAKREEAIKRLRELTLGQKGVSP